jgi:hypothetical protein
MVEFPIGCQLLSLAILFGRLVSLFVTVSIPRTYHEEHRNYLADWHVGTTTRRRNHVDPGRLHHSLPTCRNTGAKYPTETNSTWLTAREERSYNSVSTGEIVMNETNNSVAAQVAALPSLPTKELWALWDRYHPRRPENPNRNYLESRIAYKLQEEAFGGLSADTRLRLANIGIRHSKIKERRKQRDIYLAPGTVLVREWGDRDHKVSVTAEGTFEYEGRFFKSLSSVARHIAGSPWSGPAFFGLRKHGEGFE